MDASAVVASQSPASPRARPARPGRVVLWGAASFLLSLIALQAYLFTLPTDGWRLLPPAEAPLFAEDLMPGSAQPGAGPDSGELRPGDRLLAVDQAPFPLLMFDAVSLRRPDLSYAAGEVKVYTVERGGEALDIAVPVRAWTAGGIARAVWLALTDSPMGGVYRWLAWALAAFVFLRRPDLASARLFFLLESVMLGTAITTAVAPVSVQATLSPTIFYATRFAGDLFTWLLAPALGVHLILAFPSTKPPPRAAVWLLYLVPWLVLAVVWVYGLVALVPLMTGLYAVLGLLAVARLVYVGGSGPQAASVRWFAFAFGVSNLFSLAFWLQEIGWVPHVPLLHAVMFQHCLCDLIYVTGFAIAVLWHGLFDVDMIVGRSLVYVSLTALAIGVYAVVVGGMGRLLVGGPNLELSLAATAMVALAFDPARRWLQRAANRLLYGFRDEPYEILSRLGEGLRAAPRPGEALDRATRTVAEALRLPFAAVRIGAGTAVTYGEPRQVSEAFPLSHGGQVVGELVVSPRQAEGRLSASDRRLLAALATQVGTLVHSLELEADLERERIANLSAREEDRRRLGSDLHDDVGHRLTWLVRQAEAASALVDDDPAAAKQHLTELSTEAQAVIGRVRTLAHRLHPPELSALGLVEALRERLEVLRGTSAMRLRLEADDLGPVPAAIELAAYHIAREALSNALKHSGGRNCWVRLRVLDSGEVPGVLAGPRYLGLEVEDDGVGSDPGASPPGLGLVSMRSRAREVGGALVTERSPHGGTVVRATLPWLGE